MKRLFSGILTLVVLINCCGYAFAEDIPDPRASLTLSSYAVYLSPGDTKGTITISYDVRATKPNATTVGVQLIRVYKSDGTYVETISGTPENGMMASGAHMCVGDYDYHGVSGTSYYVQVIVFARIDNLFDSRAITTSSVTAP